MIKAILFDIDGVLVDSFEANFKFYQGLLLTAGYKSITREEYTSLFSYSMYDAIKNATNASKEEVDRIFQLGMNTPRQNHLIKINSIVTDTVKILKKKYKLGIVTSRLKNNVEEIPNFNKLGKYFQTIVTKEDTPNPKPSPEPIIFACDKLEIIPCEAIFIGDSESDIIAGKAAGTKTILYSKKCFANSDLYTNSFSELPKLINKL